MIPKLWVKNIFFTQKNIVTGLYFEVLLGKKKKSEGRLLRYFISCWAQSMCSNTQKTPLIRFVNCFLRYGTNCSIFATSYLCGFLFPRCQCFNSCFNSEVIYFSLITCSLWDLVFCIVHLCIIAYFMLCNPLPSHQPLGLRLTHYYSYFYEHVWSNTKPFTGHFNLAIKYFGLCTYFTFFIFSLMSQ